MPYYHCRKCHHEYEGSEPAPCDWCGAKDPYVLEEETPLECLVREIKEDPELFHKLFKRKGVWVCFEKETP